MEKELELLEDLITAEEKKLELNREVMSDDKRKELEERIESIYKIAKVVHARAHALPEEQRRTLVTIIQQLLEDSASLFLEKDAGEEITVYVRDNIQRKDIARIRLKRFFDSLLIQEYVLY